MLGKDQAGFTAATYTKIKDIKHEHWHLHSRHSQLAWGRLALVHRIPYGMICLKRLKIRIGSKTTHGFSGFRSGEMSHESSQSS